jgi:pimeloyl-ACP methyl ester carboxylesterase
MAADLPQITPGRDLKWHSCYEDFECARLDVPLDWLDPSDELRAAIAVIRLPAANRNDYRGPIFTNPGGPGGSGIYQMKNRGRKIQAVVGKNYDIISFDPRGSKSTIQPMKNEGLTHTSRGIHSSS